MGKEAQQMSGTKVPACKVLLDSLSQQSAGSPESNERAEAGPAENHPTHKTVKLMVSCKSLSWVGGMIITQKQRAATKKYMRSNS